MNTEKVVYFNSDEELDEFTKQETHILYFSSENCNVCHSVSPKLVDLTSEYDVMIGRIDINKNVKMAGQHLIFSIPTILIFNEGREIVRESRFVDFEKIDRTLKLILT